MRQLFCEIADNQYMVDLVRRALVALMQENLQCNFVGGKEADLQTQASDLSAHGISIEANPADRYLCYYKAGNEFVTPVLFSGHPYFNIQLPKTPQHDKGYYVVLGKGVPAQIPEEFRAQVGFLSDDTVILEYTAVVSQNVRDFNDADYIRDKIIAKVREENPTANILAFVRHNGETQGRQKFTIYVGGANFVLPEEIAQQPKKGHPPLTQAYCPEWVEHANEVKGEVALKGWEFIKRAPGKYVAIPREELKEKARDELGRIEKYKSDLADKLARSGFFKTDDPKRSLKEIRPGSGGVVGLECPVFEVDVTEIEKRPDNCLAWVEGQEEALVRAGNKVTPVNGGYLVQPNKAVNGIFRYIRPTQTEDLEKAKAKALALAKDKPGYSKHISSTAILADPVCSVDTLKVTYQPLEEEMEEEILTGGMKRLLALFSWETRDRKKNSRLRQVGRNYHCPSRRKPERGPCQNHHQYYSRRNTTAASGSLFGDRPKWQYG